MQKMKLTQSEKSELLKKALVEKPELIKARRLLFGLVLLWFCVRSADIVIGIVFNVIQSQGALSHILSYISFIALIVFSYSIYNGYVLFVILPIIGGLQMMAFTAFNCSNIQMALASGDRLYLTVSISSFLGGLLQTITMIIILLHRNCRVYLRTVSRISNLKK